MASKSLSAPKGTRDIYGQEARAFSRLEDIARQKFALYQFDELRIPTYESESLFRHTMGETSDVVEKEMFKFTDRGERPYALRPEGTAGVVRFFLEKKLFVKGGIHRLFYMGPMFRAERPQAGRYRQFWQIGSEHFGDPEPSADAGTVLMTAAILKEFGVGKFTIHVNSLGDKQSRLTYRDILIKYLKDKKSLLTEESRKRMMVNPLRVLDSKEDGPKLSDAPRTSRGFSTTSYPLSRIN